VIRFSAALVAVAIGVLVGGIATSELPLVYIAIVVSAVALVVLAIGVVLKREELFGEGQGLASAGAGVGPVLSGQAGQSYDLGQRDVQQRQSAHVTPPLAQGAAVLGAVFGGNAQPASPQPEADRFATRPIPASQDPTPASQEQPSGQVSPWETTATRDPWSSPAPDARPVTGAGSAPPSWFDRPDWSSADAPAAATAPSPGGAPVADEPDEDDDWPTRYSWLDDEPEESAPDGSAPEESAPEDSVPDGSAPEESGSVTDTGDQPPRLSVVTDPAPPADTSGDTAAATGHEDDAAEDTGAGAAAGAAAPDAGLVAVIPGVPRYHRPDCVLIRFMPEGDSQKLSVAQAREAGCTPCTACEPAE
jgi:hypothetical protein